MQYPLAQQQQLIGTVANLSSSGNSTLPQLLQAHAFISDVLALSFAGNTDPSAILELGSAVATSQAASTGFGLFLLAQPVVNALQQLVLFAEVCSTVPCPALRCAALPCPALPCPALPCPALPCPAPPCSAMSCPALLCPAPRCPAPPCVLPAMLKYYILLLQQAFNVPKVPA